MVPALAEARTCLFVPGNRPERFEKAFGSGADAVVFDLEDAVTPDAKGAARDAIGRWCGQVDERARGRALVRVNEAGSRHFEEDLRLLRDAGLVQVMLAKAEAPEQILAVRSRVADAIVFALVETARGVAGVDTLAHTPGVVRLVFGTLDYALDLDLDIADSPEGLAHAAAAIVLASRVAGLPPPVAGVTPQLDDESRLRADWAWARRFGFGAKLCIHPKQVRPLHAAMAPDLQAIDWARRVVSAEGESPGAAQLDGRMIDRPVVLLAQRTLQRAFRS